MSPSFSDPVERQRALRFVVSLLGDDSPRSNERVSSSMQSPILGYDVFLTKSLAFYF